MQLGRLRGHARYDAAHRSLELVGEVEQQFLTLLLRPLGVMDVDQRTTGPAPDAGCILDHPAGRAEPAIGSVLDPQSIGNVIAGSALHRGPEGGESWPRVVRMQAIRP